MGDGAQFVPAGALKVLDELGAALAKLPSDQAGVRIHGVSALSAVLGASGVVGSIAEALMGRKCAPVRAILFDKTATTNWALAWHQDRTICVKQRLPVDGFGPWTIKRGLQHVAPPYDLLARMVTLRVHLDDVPAQNAPLLIALGSHLAGKLEVDAYADVLEQCNAFACLAKAGDVWAYATPILHASAVATNPRRRRVLQVDYSADELPGGLEWLGV
ncbi:phytanoyl-CoA dioxygenase [Novosphingobium colocasiae]|uniref:Phytanoyl-CoA dioxygenase n=2 Tax=Novosphingobium colocasiae TaxID=1256513 RepID=A0A918PIT3_9SPHN|nr:phytanoyl-CoA dioxygenase [Novosphingobium colocasiae]